MSNHFIQTHIWDEKSRIWWSRHPNGRLIVFVHGFGGHGTRTWRQFPALMLDDPEFSGDDILFYGYESKRGAALLNAILLFQRCTDLIRAPDHFFNTYVIDEERPFEYRRVVFVAHSLGAAIARAALLEAYRVSAQWLGMVSLICFAPATAGARAASLARLASQSWFGFRMPFFMLRLKWPVLDDLLPISAFLTSVRNRTTAIISQSGWDIFRSRLTLFGSLENIIDVQNAIEFDLPYTVIPDLDHSAICKPNGIHHESYSRLRDSLREIA